MIADRFFFFKFNHPITAQSYMQPELSHGYAIGEQRSSYPNGPNGQPLSRDSISGLADMISRMNSDFMGRLSSIEQNMSKLGLIERDISLMRSDVGNIKRDTAEFNKRIMDLEKVSQNTCEKYNSLVKSSKTTNTRVDHLQKENESLTVELTDVRSENSRLQESYNTLKEDFLELKCRSMQENLLFFGIPEVTKQDSSNPPQYGPQAARHENVNELNANENKRESIKANTEVILREFIKTALPLDSPECVDNMVFDRVHRLGRPKKNPQAEPRPIVVKFERYTDKEKIRKAGFEINRIPKSKFKVREQYPDEIEDRRRNLYPVMFRFKQNRRNRVNLVRDKLYINGQEYDPNEDPHYIPAPPRRQYQPKQNVMTAELHHQNTGTTYIERGARQKLYPDQHARSYAHAAGERSSWRERNVHVDNQRHQLSPKRGSNVCSEPLEAQKPQDTFNTPSVETRNYYGPLNNMGQFSQFEHSRKATSPIDEQISTKKQRQYGAYNAQSNSPDASNRMEIDCVIDLDRQSKSNFTNDVSDTLSSVRQAMDGETENQNHTVGDAAIPDLV